MPYHALGSNPRMPWHGTQHQGGPAQDRASQYHQDIDPARVQANPMTGRVGGEKHVCIQNRCTCPFDSRFEALSQNAKRCNVVSRKFVTSHKCLVTAQQISFIRLLQWCSVALRTTPPATASACQWVVRWTPPPPNDNKAYGARLTAATNPMYNGRFIKHAITAHECAASVCTDEGGLGHRERVA